MSKDGEDWVLEWPGFSDGTSNKWPGPPYVRVESSHTTDVWLQKIGQTIATVLKLENPEKYRMKGWPAAYAVFSLARGDGTKSDSYLYGGPKKYRSAPEFQEHAIWLYFSGNPPSGYKDLLNSPSKKPRPSNSQDSSYVEPKKRPVPTTTVPRSQSTLERFLIPGQALVSALQIDAPNRSHSGKRVTFEDASPPVTGSSPSRMHMDSVTSSKLSQSLASGRRKSVPVTLLTISPDKWDNVHNTFPIREQINRPSRTYRIGELVWCIIEPSLLDGDNLLSIDQWPGIIEAHRVKKAVLSGDAVTEDELYHVKLLALQDALIVSGSRILPYKGFQPTPALIMFIQSLPPPSPQLPSRLYHFHHNVPYLLVEHQEEELQPPENLFLQATAAYALALQNAARLALTWGFSYPQIRESDLPEWDRKVDMAFAGLWWGPELIYVEEMVLMAPSRAQLTRHPTTAEFIRYNDGDENCAVILQIKHLKAKSSATRELGQSRAFVVGVLYELVPLLSDTPPDHVSTMPKQTAPLGMMWKQLMPQGVELSVDITLLSGRYYEDVGALPSADSVQSQKTVASVLQGLARGKYAQGNTPTSYHNTRAQMCRAAKTESTLDLEQYWGVHLELA